MMRLVIWCAALLLLVSFRSIAIAQPDPVTLVRPLDGLEINPTTNAKFVWNEATGGVGPYTYQVYVSTDPQFAPGPELYVYSIPIADGTVLFAPITASQFPVPSVLYWRVVAFDAMGDSSVSASGDFSNGMNSCCHGETGNVNNDGTRALTDLTQLVNYLFVTFVPPVCIPACNTNGDRECGTNLSDLTRMVNKMFITFEPMAPCNSFDHTVCP